MLKKMLAQQTHEKLLEMGEADETDWSAARFLKDIYECHSCVIHIAQCYVKGIIPLSRDGVFGANEIVTPELKKLVEDRIYDKSLRQKPEPVKAAEISIVKLSELPENARVIDVREHKKWNADVSHECIHEKWNTDVSHECIHEKLEFCENIPLKSIVQNPYIVGEDLQQKIILYCTKGYQSTLAADVLQKAGYLNVHIAR